MIYYKYLKSEISPVPSEYLSFIHNSFDPVYEIPLLLYMLNGVNNSAIKNLDSCEFSYAELARLIRKVRSVSRNECLRRILAFFEKAERLLKFISIERDECCHHVVHFYINHDSDRFIKLINIERYLLIRGERPKKLYMELLKHNDRYEQFVYLNYISRQLGLDIKNRKNTLKVLKKTFNSLLKAGVIENYRYDSCKYCFYFKAIRIDQELNLPKDKTTHPDYGLDKSDEEMLNWLKNGYSPD